MPTEVIIKVNSYQISPPNTAWSNDAATDIIEALKDISYLLNSREIDPETGWVTIKMEEDC